jgi:anti-sigma factor RsiW
VTRWKQIDLTCRAIVEVVNDYLDELMSAEDRASFEQHLHACPWCLTYLRQIRETVALGARLNADDLPADVEQNLLTLFRARRPA